MGEVRVADEATVLAIDPDITGSIVPLADDRIGNAVLGLRVGVGTRRLDLLPAGELTQVALDARADAANPASDLVFARPTAINQALLADRPVRWLIWSNDARAPAEANLAARVISLYDTIAVGFSVSDERLLISHWTIH